MSKQAEHGRAAGRAGGAIILAGAALAAAGGTLLYRRLAGGARTGAQESAAEVQRTVTIGKPADEVFECWQDPQRQAQIMDHFVRLGPAAGGQGRLHWEYRLPTGQSVGWDTQVVESVPGERTRWASLPDAPFSHEGELQLRPAPGGRGTEATLRLRFELPDGPVGGLAAKAVQGPVLSGLVGHALRRFKSLAETGEVPTLERNPAARPAGA